MRSLEAVENVRQSPLPSSILLEENEAQHTDWREPFKLAVRQAGVYPDLE